MQKITCLHFPETIAQNSRFRQLLLFFDSMTQLLPAEDSFQTEHPLVKAEMLNQYAPHPFGDNLANFNRLIHDIQGHGSDFYGSCLSSLSSSTAQQVDESSVNELIAMMKPKNEPEVDRHQADALYQARLLLKLAEVHGVEEEELQEKIQSLNLKKSHLLSALKGDEDEMGTLALGLEAGINSEPPLRFQQRLKAWATLFLADTKNQPWFITTGPNDAFNLIEDAVGSQTKPEHLFSISLADPILDAQEDQDSSAFLIDFQSKTRDCRDTLFAHLEKAAQTGSFQRDQDLAQAMDTWEKTVQELPNQSTQKIEFHLFQMPFPKLLVEGLGLKNMQEKESSVDNTILGVLK